MNPEMLVSSCEEVNKGRCLFLDFRHQPKYDECANYEADQHADNDSDDECEHTIIGLCNSL